MGKNVADIKLTANSGIELPLPNPKDVKKVLILGNTIGFFGYPGEKCNISNIHGEDAKRFAWMYNCALLGVEFEILGEEEEFNYYSDLFQKIKERYGYEVEALFTEMKCNDDYDYKLNKYIKEMEGTGKKRFDFAIMNPPYERNLHLKFLEKVIKVADKTVNISPVRWLQDPLARYKKNSDYYKYKSSIIDTIESLTVISDKDSQKLFDVAIFGMDLGIYTCGKGGFNANSLINSLTNRLTKYCITHPAPFENGKKDGFRVRIPELKSKGANGSGKRTNKTVGNFEFLGRLFVFENGCKDGLKWHEWYGKNQHSKTTDEITCSIKFNSKAEAENFIISTNTMVFKYISHQVIRDVHITSDKVLWMGDYTEPWTNARFCEYFGITGFISDTEAEPGSEWEIILETMKKYA